MNIRRRSGARPVLIAAALLTAILLAPLPFRWETRIDGSIGIALPRSQVFDYVTTPGNWPRWHPSSLAVRGAVDHPARPGERATEDFVVAGWHGTVTWTVTDRDAPNRWTIVGHADGSGVAGGTSGTITYTLAPTERGTLFRREFVYPAPNLLFVLIDVLHARARIEAESALALTQLKTVLEAQSPQAGAGRMALRSELYFGRSQPGGGSVTDAQWRRFVDAEVTPRFPRGFTVLRGDGQYRGADGAIQREHAYLLVLIHPADEEADRHIEQLRSIYRRRFKQEAVLRVDSPVALRAASPPVAAPVRFPLGQVGKAYTT